MVNPALAGQTKGRRKARLAAIDNRIAQLRSDLAAAERERAGLSGSAPAAHTEG